MLKTERAGERPQTSDEGPHRQMTQKSSPSMWEGLVARVFAIEGVVEGDSAAKSSSRLVGPDPTSTRTSEPST